MTAVGDWIEEKALATPDVDEDALKLDADQEMCRWAKEALRWFASFTSEADEQICSNLAYLMSMVD